MKIFSLALMNLSILIQINSQQTFITDVTTLPNIPQVICMNSQSLYGGIPTRENMNLLATLLGDNPSSLLRAGQTLVPVETVNVLGNTFALQTFVFTESGNTRKKNLPMGPNLKKFLTDPFNGEKFDLTLPFNDPNVGLSSRSACIRISNDSLSNEYHMAIDFDNNSNTTQIFDVIAPADGIVYNRLDKGNIAIVHKTKNGKEFLTIYAHLNIQSKRHLTDGTMIKRGDKIGTINQELNSLGRPAYSHLHFGVALKGPEGVINGVNIPSLWYLIDPFGVYEERRNRFDANTYNYLPVNNITSEIRDIKTTSVFMTNPINGSFYFKDEDCIPFNPNSLKIVKVSSSEYRIESNVSSMISFSNFEEASKALQILKRSGFTQRCFIGRPDPSFYYFK